MPIIDELMSTIDDIKLKLTDMEYTTLCDQIIELHETKKSACYEIKFPRLYLEQQRRRGKNNKGCYVQDIIIQRLILELNDVGDTEHMSDGYEPYTIESIQKEIEEHGTFRACQMTLMSMMKHPHQLPSLWKENMASHKLYVDMHNSDELVTIVEMEIIHITSLKKL